MAILYKYCDQFGVVKIIEALELKLPHISEVSEVNDPYEWLASLQCANDYPAIKERYLAAFKRNNHNPPLEYEKRLKEQYEKGDIQKIFTESVQKVKHKYRQTTCLLSVSKTAQNTVMWAHYADKQKGAVIGIDFENVFPTTHRVHGVKMRTVEYSKQPPKINVLSEHVDEAGKMELEKIFLTKSDKWCYEQECRTLFPDNFLEGLREHDLASFKEVNGKKSWFLRLNPLSIKEIIFGLKTDDSLRLTIRKLKDRPELQHVKLYQTVESDTYDLSLTLIDESV